MAKSKKRKRQRFHFWLDISKFQDVKLIPIIGSLKESKRFTDVIRMGLRLIPSLMDGRTDVLFQMFPDIRKTLRLQLEADILEELNVQQSKEVIQHIVELKGVISQFKDQPILAAPIQGTMSVRRVTTEDEMQLEVTQAKSNVNAAQNFLNSMKALQSDKPVVKATGGLQSLNTGIIAPPSFKEDDDDMLLKVT